VAALSPTGSVLYHLEGPLPSDDLRDLTENIEKFYATAHAEQQTPSDGAVSQELPPHAGPAPSTITTPGLTANDPRPHTNSSNDADEFEGHIALSTLVDAGEEMEAVEEIPGTVTLQIKLPDGRNSLQEFSAAANLLEVFSTIDVLREESPGSGMPYVLVSNQPKAQWGADKENSSLYALGLTGRTVVSVVAHSEGHVPPPSKKSQTRGESSRHFHQQPITEPELSVGGAAANQTEKQAGYSSKKCAQDMHLQARDTPSEIAPPCMYMLQLKFPHGEAMKAEFEADVLLSEVARYVDDHRSGNHEMEKHFLFSSCTHSLPVSPVYFCQCFAFVGTDAGGAYSLVCAFPRKTYSNDDMGSTLRDLGLGPRTTLLVQTRNSTSSTSKMGTNPGTKPIGTGIFGFLLAAAGALLSYLNPWSYLARWNGRLILGGGSQDASVAADGHAVVHGPTKEVEAPPATVNDRSHAVRKREKKIYSLENIREERDWRPDPSKEGNNYWNGNSTQFNAGDDGKDA